MPLIQAMTNTSNNSASLSSITSPTLLENGNVVLAHSFILPQDYPLARGVQAVREVAHRTTQE